MKRLVAVVFLFLPLWVYSETVKCNQYWPDVPDQETDCKDWRGTGLPNLINGSEMRIFHYAKDWSDSKEETQLLTTMARVISHAVPLYNQWFKTPSVYATLYNERSPDETFSEQSSIDPALHKPCRISLYLNIPKNKNLAAQIGAHEIFHCIQDRLIFHKSSEMIRGVSSYDWWIEGSANFFAAFPFPEGGLDIQHGETYNLRLPLDRQSNPYSTVLFFDTLRQHLGMTYGQIINLLKRQPVESTYQSERQALSRWPQIDEMMFQFARHIADRNIENVGGIPYKLEPVTYPNVTVIDSPNEEVSLSVRPFTVAPFRIQIPAGTRVKVHLDETSSLENRIRVSYRQSANKKWRELTTTEFDSECGDENPVLEMLATSVAEADELVRSHLSFEFLNSKCTANPRANLQYNKLSAF